MKFCIKCGKQFPDKQTSCHDCKHKLDTADSEDVMRLILLGKQSFENGDSEEAAGYFEDALKIEPENEAAENGLTHANNDIKGKYCIAEATVTPEERLAELLKGFASDEDIVPDIYKEITIESVTAKYYTFFGGTFSTEYAFSESEHSNRYTGEYDSFTFPYNLIEGKTADGEQGKKLMMKFEAEICSRIKIGCLKRFNPYGQNETDGKTLYRGIEFDADRDVLFSEHTKDSSYAQYTNFKKQCMKKAGADTIFVTNNGLASKATIIYFPVMTVVYSYKGQKYIALADLYFKKPVFYKTYPMLKSAAEVEEEVRKVNKLPASRKSAPKAGGIFFSLIGLFGFLCYFIFSNIADKSDDFTFILVGITNLLGGLVMYLIQRKQFKKASAAVSEATSHHADILKKKKSTLSSQYDAFFKEYSGLDSVKTAQSKMPSAESTEDFKAAVAPADVLK